MTRRLRTSQSIPHKTAQTSAQTLWELAAISLPTGFALFLYWWRAAPGLTWAFYGADGGDLLTAAMVNGVPHPAGYPLYTLLLRGWLWLGHLVNAQSDPAFWGNRFSALCAAGAVAFTVAATAEVLRHAAHRWLWAALTGLAFAITPLAWSQALITEVYGLHVLLIAAMGWTTLRPVGQTHRFPMLTLGVLMGFGAAHHLTSLMLWPALLYWRLRPLPRRVWLQTALQMLAIAFVVALFFYGGLVWRIAASPTTPPVAWGYPRDLAGLWWLISGAAYRDYVFGMTLPQYVGRLAALARLLVEQFTPVGLALVIGGLAVWDRQRASLRNGAILWVVPISLYAAGYNTLDSYIYLLPVVWLMGLALGQGLASGSTWLMQRAAHAPRFNTTQITAIVATVATLALVVLMAWRLPQFDLRHDQEAQAFLTAAETTLEPGSLVISNADASTFALWYGQWGSNFAGDGTLDQGVPDLVLVNYALYQFGWYRNLLHDLYPEVPRIGTSIVELIAANRAVRPIYLTEPLPEVPENEVTQTGIFWHLNDH